MRAMPTRKKSPARQKKKGLAPRPYAKWRTDPFDRKEDAAYAFGHRLILHCRDEALKDVPRDAETRAAIEKAVDTALHNVCDLIEGYWKLDIGNAHEIEPVLQARVLDKSHTVVETHELTGLDLPIGYWKWAQDREFR